MKKLSPQSEKSVQVIAGRLRIERTELFKRLSNGEKALRAMIGHYADKIGVAVEEKGHDPKNARRIHEIIHEETVLLRASIRIWLNALIRDSTKMGFRHLGDALMVIFRHNREAARYIVEAESGYRPTTDAYAFDLIERKILSERAIFEARLVFGLKVGFASRANPSATDASDNVARIVKKITKKNMAGLNPSERVWDLTTRAEQDLKRLVTNGMAGGENPATIARRLKKYVMPAAQRVSQFGVEFGPGVYRSPYRNAMRLARTEVNKAYVKAQVQFAKGKSWLTAAQITLSPAHDIADECDELAARGPMPIEEAEKLIPAHPHCMCSITPIIDPKYLGEEEAA